MQIDRTLADAYLSGMPMDSYRDAWFFTASSVAGQVGKNIFTPPSSGPELLQKARTAAQGIETGVQAFVPLNLPVWDALCPDWRQRLAEIQIDLIAGFPEPFDATVERGPDGRLHVIFDLCCWTKYIEKMDVGGLVKNLLTHELFHVVTAQLHPGLEKACISPEYRTQLDAVTFNEGFAHLLSYQTQELDAVDWHSARLAAMEECCRKRMAVALQERDAAAQEKNLYEALCGNYYENMPVCAGCCILRMFGSNRAFQASNIASGRAGAILPRRRSGWTKPDGPCCPPEEEPEAGNPEAENPKAEEPEAGKRAEGPGKSRAALLHLPLAPCAERKRSETAEKGWKCRPKKRLRSKMVDYFLLRTM